MAERGGEKVGQRSGMNGLSTNSAAAGVAAAVVVGEEGKKDRPDKTAGCAEEESDGMAGKDSERAVLGQDSRSRFLRRSLGRA